ncbi:uncharacterized protein BJX67DRAFT_303348 [Aspergillus lucknowensis]|uniref:Uncharacterized protein n=1 Tax=Aspergillus lucknowensis TaxID=176173 RepID=A0ABR4LZX3_9EURO
MVANCPLKFVKAISSEPVSPPHGQASMIQGADLLAFCGHRFNVQEEGRKSEKRKEKKKKERRDNRQAIYLSHPNIPWFGMKLLSGWSMRESWKRCLEDPSASRQLGSTEPTSSPGGRRLVAGGERIWAVCPPIPNTLTHLQDWSVAILTI